jgi:hypothetical protein
MLVHKIQMLGKSQKKEYNIHNRVEHVLEKVVIDGELNSIVFVWRATLCYTFLINVMTFLVFTFTVLNILLSCNWVNLVFSVLFRTMEVGDLPDTFTYHAGMLHIVCVCVCGVVCVCVVMWCVCVCVCMCGVCVCCGVWVCVCCVFSPSSRAVFFCFIWQFSPITSSTCS